MDNPMTGYALRRAFRSIAGADQTISFGTLYPILDKLAEAGEIKLNYQESCGGRPQKLATITVTGRQHFFKMATEPTPINKKTQFTFLMKIQFLHLLDQNQQVNVLTDFRNFSMTKLQQIIDSQEELADNPHMLQKDIEDALLVKQLQIKHAQVQVDWVSKLLEERKGALIYGKLC